MCDCNCNNLSIKIPNSDQHLHSGDKIRLERFDTEVWIVNFGWYSFSGNRPMWGCYLSNDRTGVIKPLLLSDLDDVYMITN